MDDFNAPSEREKSRETRCWRNSMMSRVIRSSGWTNKLGSRSSCLFSVGSAWKWFAFSFCFQTNWKPLKPRSHLKELSHRPSSVSPSNCLTFLKPIDRKFHLKMTDEFLTAYSRDGDDREEKMRWKFIHGHEFLIMLYRLSSLHSQCWHASST